MVVRLKDELLKCLWIAHYAVVAELFCLTSAANWEIPTWRSSIRKGYGFASKMAYGET